MAYSLRSILNDEDVSPRLRASHAAASPLPATMNSLATLAHLAENFIPPAQDVIRTTARGWSTSGQPVDNLTENRGNAANVAPRISNLGYDRVGSNQTMQNMLVTCGPSPGAILQPLNTFAPSRGVHSIPGFQVPALGVQGPAISLHDRTGMPPAMSMDSRVHCNNSHSNQEPSADIIAPQPDTPIPHTSPTRFLYQQGGTTITTSRNLAKPSVRRSRPRIVTRANPTAQWTTPNETVAFNMLPGPAEQSSTHEVQDSSQDQHMQGPYNNSGNPQDTVEQPTGSSNRIATDGFQPIVILSPQRGNLYTRRMKSPSISPQSQPSVAPSHKIDAFFDTNEDVPPEHEFSFNAFNIFRALLNHAELIFEMIRHLEVDDIISLYAISKDFHDLVNSRFYTMIKGQAMIRAPESAKIFRFKCYKNLCQFDPAKRENNDIENRVRDVPTFRWLSMIMHREQTVREIIHLLAAEGHHLPKKTSIAIKKIWFTMDICDSSRRIGLTHNRKFWTDSDLTLATIFFMKLDMRFTDPLDGNGDSGIRRMMMAQRGMTPLLRLLKREFILSLYELMQEYVEWLHVPHPEHRSMSICGVPSSNVGRWSREGWGRGTRRLIRPDEAVMMEEIRRGLGLRERYKDMLLFGYVDPRTFQSTPAIQGLKVNDAEWEDTDDSDDEDMEGESPKGIDQEDFDLPG